MDTKYYSGNCDVCHEPSDKLRFIPNERFSLQVNEMYCQKCLNPNNLKPCMVDSGDGDYDGPV